MFHVVQHSLRDMMLVWAEEAEEDRFRAWQDFVATTQRDVQELISGPANEDTVSSLKRVLEQVEGFFSPSDEPKAVAHYLNNGVPGTWRLISVHRDEYPGFANFRNVTYQFIWSEPD